MFTAFCFCCICQWGDQNLIETYKHLESRVTSLQFTTLGHKAVIQNLCKGMKHT